MATSSDGPSPGTSPSPAPAAGLTPRAPRAQLVHAVMCRFADQPEFLQVTTLNISQSGMLVEGHVKPPLATMVDFKFILESGFEILSGSGSVVRHGTPQLNGEASIGIQFQNLDPAKQRILARVVELNSESYED